jgi:hypothetical protein
MKFPFLTSLFTKKYVTANQQPVLDVIPDSEIEDLIDAVVEEAISEPPFDIVQDLNVKIIDQKIVVEPQIENSIIDPIAFDFIKELNGSRFELNNEHKISRITWSGSVNLETASSLLTLGANSVENSGFTKLILDRSNLTEFETEARVWIKGLLKTRAKKIVKKVERMAMINAKTAKGTIFSNFIGSAINMVMPDLYMKKFDNEDEALTWLLK